MCSHIYIVDDDNAALMSVRAVLEELESEIKCFFSAEDFLSTAAIDQPGCLVTDLQMPGINGVELQRTLVDQESPLSIVVVTGVADVATAVSIMKLGAVTILEKPYEPDELLAATKEALQSSQMRWKKDQRERTIRECLSRLTVEEQQIMKGMLANCTNKAIAMGLDLGKRTLDRRRNSILEKMRVNSVTELAILLSHSFSFEQYRTGTSKLDV